MPAVCRKSTTWPIYRRECAGGVGISIGPSGHSKSTNQRILRFIGSGIVSLVVSSSIFLLFTLETVREGFEPSGLIEFS